MVHGRAKVIHGLTANFSENATIFLNDDYLKWEGELSKSIFITAQIKPRDLIVKLV